MKIMMVLISYDFPPDIRVEKELRALLAAGHQITLVCENRKQRPAREEWQGITIIRLPPQPLWWRQLNTATLFIALRNPIWESQLRKIIQTERPDVLHIHDLPFVGPALEVARPLKLPVVADLHENFPAYLALRRPTTQNYLEWVSFDPKRFARYERRALPACARVIVVIEEAAERVAELGVAQENIYVVGNSEDLENVHLDDQPLALPHSELRIVYVGGVQELRGLQTAVAGLPKILTEIPTAQLVVVGDGLYRPILEEQARKLGVGHALRMEGHQPFARVHSYIQTADVCIVPHLADELVNTTIPHKLFQYMYMGKPVVVTSAKPLKRIVTASNAGLVYESGNADDFARAILQLRAPVLRGSLGENGRRAVLERYNWQNDSKALIALYASLD